MTKNANPSGILGAFVDLSILKVLNIWTVTMPISLIHSSSLFLGACFFTSNRRITQSSWQPVSKCTETSNISSQTSRPHIHPLSSSHFSLVKPLEIYAKPWRLTITRCLKKIEIISKEKLHSQSISLCNLDRLLLTSCIFNCNIFTSFSASRAFEFKSSNSAWEALHHQKAYQNSETSNSRFEEESNKKSTKRETVCLSKHN